MDCSTPGDCQECSKEHTRRMWMIFSFLEGVVDRRTAWKKEAALTNVPLLVFELMVNMAMDNRREGWSVSQLMELKYGLEEIKGSLVRTIVTIVMLDYIR